MPAAKPCWDVLFCMIFYEWNGKLFDRTISIPGTDNQELVNLVAAGNRDDKIINGIKADTRAVIFRLGQEYHIDLLDRRDVQGRFKDGYRLPGICSSFPKVAF